MYTKINTRKMTKSKNQQTHQLPSKTNTTNKQTCRQKTNMRMTKKKKNQTNKQTKRKQATRHTKDNMKALVRQVNNRLLTQSRLLRLGSLDGRFTQ